MGQELLGVDEDGVAARRFHGGNAQGFQPLGQRNETETDGGFHFGQDIDVAPGCGVTACDGT